MEYIIDGAYRAKKWFVCLNGYPATIIECHYGLSTLVEADTKAILQSKIPGAGTPNYVTLYTTTSNGEDWIVKLRMARYLFDNYFEKLPLSVAINPVLAMKMKMVGQQSFSQPMQR